MAIADFNQIKDVLTALDIERPARFAYTDEALDATGAAEITALSGVYAIEDTSQINSIPDPDQVAMDDLVLATGLRSQASTISRMMVNHFFGRLGLNLIKLTEKVKALAEDHLVNRYITPSGEVMENLTMSRTADQITLVKHRSRLDASAPMTSSAAISLLAAVYNGNAGVMTGADKAALDDVAAGAVRLSGNQTVAGIKTFSSIPVLPASDPTTDNQAVRKAYVDYYFLRYDYIVDSQSKADALFASGTWLGAKNVLFTANVTHTGQITVPATVQKIHALNEATITITGITGTTAYAFGYTSRPTDLAYEISGLVLDITANTTVYTTGFYKCINLKNCSATLINGSSSTGTASAYEDCIGLVGCYASGGTVTSVAGYGYMNCEKLYNCSGSGNSSISGSSGFHTCSDLDDCYNSGGSGISKIGFNSCTRLNNCVVDQTSGNAVTGFASCTQVNNCHVTIVCSSTLRLFSSCTHVNNCVGTGNASAAGAIGFNQCNYVSNSSGTVVCGGGATANGFYDCDYITSCFASASAAAGAYSYQICQYMSCCNYGLGANGFYVTCTNIRACRGTADN